MSDKIDKNKKRIAKYSRGSVALSRGKFVTKKDKDERKEAAFNYFFNESTTEG